MPPTEQSPEQTDRYQLAKKGLLIVVVVTALSGLIFAGYKLYIYFLPRGTLDSGAYRASLLEDKPEGLQNSLVLDLKKGVNDENTKSALYFITHRYFDNGGNIYEIYDYINKHQELAFLKEAEKIYPQQFDLIRQKITPPVFNDGSLYALLAYFEVMDTYDYADMATLSTAANQYAKLAYITKRIEEDYPELKIGDPTATIKRNIVKAKYFVDKARGDVSAVLDGTFDMSTITDRDVLVGLNQYASALRYLEASGNAVVSQKSAIEVFEFTRKLATEKVTELRMFTHLLDASTLILVSPENVAQLDISLQPIYTYDTVANKPRENSIIDKIIKSRKSSEVITIKDRTVIKPNYDVYGKRNTVALAKISNNFKAWLMANGWTEKDFE